MDEMNQDGKNKLMKEIDKNIKFVKENISIANWLKNFDKFNLINHFYD